ncbi:MAG: hypothetical protein F4X99_07050 [Gammaproteobacteria bacterium]|nr:hypothetical protein [Gammaproteobacteria bacterium]MYE83560.1 hypothetical protein [Gammaproteobacteria bacterium]
MSGDFSIGGVANQLGVQLGEEKDALGDMVKNYDADDPMAAFNLEMEASKYKAEMSMMAALVKDLSDVQQQIIQKV